MSTVTPRGVGVEIEGVAGADLVQPARGEECQALLAAHGVVIYREAHLDDDQLVAFSRMLGEVQLVPNGALEGHPEVAPVTRDRSKDAMAAYRQGTFFWHIDGAQDLVPNKTTLLTAKVISDEDEGDTEFANTYAAYEALPADEQAALADVRAIHSLRASQSLVYPEPTEKQLAAWASVPAREHPVVWKRRDGRSSLLIGATTDEIAGRPRDEGKALLDRLLEWASQPQFVVRHHWRQGDLVVWDNTGMLHRARPYASDSPRLMHRTTIAGEEEIA